MSNATLDWHALRVGDELPTLMLDVSFDRVTATPAATRDYFLGHRSLSFATREQNQPTIYLNTMSLQGFVDRVALEWAGGAWFVSWRKMTMFSSAYADAPLRATGHVVALDERNETRSIVVDVQVASGGKLAVAAEVLLRTSAT